MSTTLDKGRVRSGQRLPESNTKTSHVPAGATGGNLTKSSGGGGVGGVTKSSNEKINSSSNRGSSVSNGNRPEGNPFEEEEWDEYPNDALVDNGEPGVAVKALYDYDGAECDELSFRRGEDLFLTRPFLILPHLFIIRSFTIYLILLSFEYWALVLLFLRAFSLYLFDLWLID